MRAKLIHDITLLSNWEKIEIRIEGTETISRTVTVGRWEVTVEASYDGKPYARGSDIINVRAGQDNGVQISMSPADNGDSSGGNACVHTWGNWTVATQADFHDTVCRPGTERSTCSLCQETQTRNTSPCLGTYGLEFNGTTVTGIDPAVTVTITHLCIPNGVTTIGENAFNVHTSITSVTIPDGVTIIGSGAFSNTSLTSVTIPNSVTTIGNGAFSYTSITRIDIPRNVTSIGRLTSNSLNEINVHAENIYYSSLGGVLYNKDQSTLIEFPTARSGHFNIPNSVITIGHAAFASSSITSVTIPNSVITISDMAFDCAANLTEVNIPDSVTTIGHTAFFRTGLTSIIIPSSITYIGDGAFSVCTNLTSITISYGVTTIGDGAFISTGITSITIPASVTTIGSGAFLLTGLTSVTIPASVTSIGTNAFGQTLLTSVTFNGTDISFDNNSFPGNNLFNLYSGATGGLGIYTRPNSNITTNWTKQP
jgi:hypothetical protein